MRFPIQSLSVLAAFLITQGLDAAPPPRKVLLRAAEQRLMALRTTLGLSENHAFKARSVFLDELGQTHVRADQYYGGLRVLGGDAILHGKEGRFGDADASHLTESVYRDISLSPNPTLSANEAIALAGRDSGFSQSFSAIPQSELVVFPLVKSVVAPSKRHLSTNALNALDMETQVEGYRLAYEVCLWADNPKDGIQAVRYLVDAHTGDILLKHNNLHTEQPAKGKGLSQFSGEVSLDTAQIEGGFELRDLTRGKGGNVTYDMAHDNFMSSKKGNVFKHKENTWGDGQNYAGNGSHSVNGQTAAVDAHHGLSVSWDFYKNVFERNGIDGKGTATFSRVHAGKSWVNACWGANNLFGMTYGDGNASMGFKVLTALDVVGHELSHGVCATSAALVYLGESGGLNEANSDIGGTMVEYYGLGGGFAAQAKTIPDKGGNFTIGEMVAPRPLRYMDKPSKDGKSPDAWSPSLGSIDVHYSSGPANRMFYFLSQGATREGEASTPYLPDGMQGIGNDKAARIWFRALFCYMKSNTNYAAARAACLKAAGELYGLRSAETEAVAKAWAAINVGSASVADNALTPATHADLTTPLKAQEPVQPWEGEQDPVLSREAPLLAEPDMAEIKKHLEFLCSNQCAGRLTGSAGERVAGDYIAKCFQENGLSAVKTGLSATGYHMPWAYAQASYLKEEANQAQANAWWSNEAVAQAGQAFNIGGVIPGSDPQLKNEYIVVLGHYDHLGKTQSGICRGADDNASGTVGVLEMARCLKDAKPKRSLFLLAVSGEEKGLLGSKAFLRDCPIKASAIKGCINMDMIGRNGDTELHVTPAKLEGRVSTLTRDARKIASEQGLTLSAGIDQFIQSSDQANFIAKGIPSVFFNTGLHGDYHTPRDTVEKLNMKKMAVVMKIVRDLALKAANDGNAPGMVPSSEWSTWQWGPFSKVNYRLPVSAETGEQPQ